MRAAIPGAAGYGAAMNCKSGELLHAFALERAMSDMEPAPSAATEEPAQERGLLGRTARRIYRSATRPAGVTVKPQAPR